ncbi:GDSL-type esterase/lipase family protein [Aquisphaera insulae]|uniref:GDSL-type esterase/lipase family protein n=1 Tax=Aquisphaera insulae TaxID=2712864 RepID=UPI0013EBC90C|nr:GDSL-type esterase/lipase family protein [Aquisphaera insulae]
MNAFRLASCVVSLAFMLGLLATAPARAGEVYLSLGDSVAFGYDPSDPNYLTPSHGDQGYVKPFADTLGAMNGGVRPTVLNLAIPGEQSTSFFDPKNLSPTGPPRAWELNLNYAGTNGMVSQNDLMLSEIMNLPASDHITAVSLIFGANDIFAVLGSDAYKNGDAATKLALISGAISTALHNYGVVLTELQQVAPGAHVYLPGYYNPFPEAYDPTDHALYDLVLSYFNPNLTALAHQFGATYVDTYSLFVGHELEFTNIATGDFHPNALGYAAIGAALSSAAVPEPSSVISLALGIAGAAVVARRRTLAA